MLKDSKDMSLTRRLVDFYLMFGLAGIVSLVFGIIFLLWSDSGSSEDQTLVPVVQKMSTRIVSDHAKHAGKNVQHLLEQYSTDHHLLYCALIGPDGRYLAHTDPKRIGDDSQITLLQSGITNEIYHVNFRGEQNSSVCEYRKPLNRAGQHIGVLQVASMNLRQNNWPSKMMDRVPLTMVLPVLIILVGIGVLRRSVEPSREIETQLRHLSFEPNDDWYLHTVTEKGAASAGWNRVVDRITSGMPLDNLEDRINQALGGFKEQSSERVLRTLPDGVAITDKDGRISFANKALAALLKRENPQELQEMTVEDLFDLDQMKNGNEIRQQFQHQSSFSLVVELYRTDDPADGVLRISRSLIQDQEEGDAAYVWTVRDITQQKLSDEMRTQFVYSATHELRTPLTNIKAYAETLALDEEIDIEKQKEFCNIINTEATRLSRFVDDLLDISRMEAGSITLARHETDLLRLLGEVVEKIQPQIDQKHLTFNSIIPPKLSKLQLDKDKVSAALVNLLGNAVKYTPEGGAVAMKVENATDEIRIHVEDSGIGISADELPKVFNKFFRSTDKRLEDITGSGLGLSFAQEVARLHGGKIDIHSELNKGSKFTLTLPIS